MPEFTDEFLIGMRQALLALMRCCRIVDIDQAMIELNREGHREAVRVIELARKETLGG